MLGLPDMRRGWAGDAWASMLESCLREWSTAAMGRVWVSENPGWPAGPATSTRLIGVAVRVGRVAYALDLHRVTRAGARAVSPCRQRVLTQPSALLLKAAARRRRGRRLASPWRRRDHDRRLR
jgi:hypothetical protein